MAGDVRFIVLNADEKFGAELRGLLQHSRGVKIIAEVDEPALLGQAVKQFPVDIVFVNLDPQPEAVLRMAVEAVAAVPDLAIFAASESTDGQLILQALRSGVREFFPRPIEAETLRAAIEKIAVHRDQTQRIGKLITVTGTAGGVGSTILATNLAVELAALGNGTVALIDLDYRFGQVATFLDVEPTYTLSDLCATPEHLEPQVVARALVKHDSGVRVLSRPATLAQAETMTAASCVGVLSTLLQISDCVVADGPARFDPTAKSVLDVADVSLLLVQLLVPSVRNASRILENMRENGYNLDRAKLICNRVGSDTGQLSVHDVSETLGLKSFASIPDDWVTASGAINLGEPLAVYSPKSKLRLAIQKIAERLHDTDSESDDKGAGKKSLIGRIFANS